MCGICGYIDYSGNTNAETLQSMVISMRNRGPDDCGNEVFCNSVASMGFGQTRLSILDLSQAGHQPMFYNDYVIVLNGEVYNFRELRKELQKLNHSFLSESDTEVVIHAFAEWGIKSVHKFIGMFAFAVYNRKTSELTLVRDRAGIKPLYYYWYDEIFLFASELKAFHKHPRFKKQLNQDAIDQYTNFGFVPSPCCIFNDCHKLDAGTFLNFNLQKRNYSISRYWDINHYYKLPNLSISYDEALSETERLLHSASEYRMISDVPVGIFLSGGYDSSAIAALLQCNRTEKLMTFTIGFDQGVDEAPNAREVARYLGTDHSELYCSSKEAQNMVHELPTIYDEPFADSSAIPTILVSRLARKRVKVALSADAGDEIFAGYVNHKTYLEKLQLIHSIPISLRKIMSVLSKSSLPFIPSDRVRTKMAIASEILAAPKEVTAQKLFACLYLMPPHVLDQAFVAESNKWMSIFDASYAGIKDELSVALAIDYSFYLQNDILTKVDRATMSTSLEGREPLLDHRIVEFVAQLPSHFKFGKSQKMILKDIVHRHIPEQLLKRPKTGFSPPIYSWLQKDLAYLLDDFLCTNMIKEAGVYNPEYVQKLKEHCKIGIGNHQLLWRILQFHMWYQAWGR